MKFCQIFKPIFVSLSPNTEKDDIFLAFKLLFQCWRWKKGETIEKLEEEFKKYLGVKHAVSFNSGRSALMAILDALKIKKGDEILLQAFTCNSAVNPILKKGAKPVFADIDDTFNIAPLDLRKKISSRSKAVMIQHNFGWPAKIEEIQKITRDYNPPTASSRSSLRSERAPNNLFLIEDCAHSLGARYKGKLCGTFGDAAFFSFGRDKIISSVFGGMAVTNDDKIGERLEKFQEKLTFPSNFWIFQQLLHPTLVNYLILPAYGLNQHLGKILIGFFHKLSILSKAVYKKEKGGELPQCFPKRLPNALSALALNQFRKLEKFNEHRREIVSFYENALKNTNSTLPLARPLENRTPTFMRYPILIEKNTDEILKSARKKKIFLDDGWRKSPVVPPDTDIKKMKYIVGTCPRAERVAQTILNLPTHINISEKEAQKIVDFLKKYGS